MPQQQPPAPVSPTTSVQMMGAAGNAASERRNNKHPHDKRKSLINYFSDRSTPSYARSKSRSNIAQPEATINSNTAFVQPTRSAHKLALLKSTSTRDLSLVGAPLSASTVNLSSSSSTTTSSSMERQRTRSCDANCLRHIKELEKRVVQLDQELQDQRAYTRQLEVKLDELTRRVEQQAAAAVVVVEKHSKKSPNLRKQNVTNANNADGGTGAGGNAPQSKLTAWMNLSNWWKSRPSIATLKERSIYKDEPCFDTEIESVLKHDVHMTVPKIVVNCCDLIEEKYCKSTEPIEGIYRQCGDYNKIQTLRFNIDANDYEALRQPQVDIHTLTGVLKLFLREIKSPLVSTNEAKTFIGRPSQWLLTDLLAKIDILKRLIRSLPEVNRDTMGYLFKHFNRLTKVPLQQISAETLSLSVSPSIFHAVPQSGTQDLHELLKQSEIMADCVKIMIEYQSRIFECTAERRRRILSVRHLRKTLSHPDLKFQNIF